MHPHNGEVKQSHTQNEPRARIAIRCEKDSPYETGFTRVPNYAQWFWKVILGPLPISAYESILSRWFEGKEKNGKKRRDPFPSLETLAAELHVDPHRLIGRWRKTKSGQRYWDKGILEILKEHGFLTYRTGRLNGRKKLYFTLSETLPVLTDAQVQQLPEDTREKHAEWVERPQCELLLTEAVNSAVNTPLKTENQTDIMCGYAHRQGANTHIQEHWGGVYKGTKSFTASCGECPEGYRVRRKGQIAFF
jgi:hypothetical protein